MCGIAGIVSIGKMSIEMQALQEMTNAIAHRGPDAESHWTSPNGLVGLGHRRLAIIDLSASGNQPMHYSGRYHIVFNGEIYNYLELKSDLINQGFTFKTQSDTEVLLAMFARYKEACLEKLDGMFSFLIYDEQEEYIFAACDRFGEKPFFYNYIPGKHFVFASEMKGLWAKGVEKTVNNRMLFNYLAHGYVLNSSDLSETFYEGCTRLPHSHYLKMNLSDGKPEIKKYYDINWQQINHSISFEDAGEKFKTLFKTSLSRRLRSDVDLGCSLSGGLDSAVIVCTLDEMFKKGTGRLKTFSARNPGFNRDEGKYIDSVIQNCAVEPIAVYPDSKDIAHKLDEIFSFQEEPFGDASILMQYLVMDSARKNGVTVLLDGQGADEVLAGYHHYFPPFIQGLKKLNPTLAREEYRAYTNLHQHNTINPPYKNSMSGFIKKHFPLQVNKLKNLRLGWDQFTKKELHPDFYAAYKEQGYRPDNEIGNDLNKAMYQQAFYGDLQSRLRFADRNSMAHGRELRLPYLSHDLVDFIYSLPSTYKIHNGWTKYIMRETFKSILPPKIYSRVDKIGYESPQKTWMAEKNMQEKIMDSRERLVHEHILDRKLLSRKPMPHGSYEAGDKSWRHLMSSCVIS